MNKNKIVKNASWIIICRIVQSVLSLVIGMISARYLGPSNYGLISYATSLIAFVLPIVQLGLRSTLVEVLISSPTEEGKIIGTSILMTVTSSFFGIIGVCSFTLIANAGEIATFWVCALQSISLLFQMTEMIQYWFQAKLLSKYTSIVSLAAYMIVSAYKVFLLITAKSIYWFCITSCLDYLIISAALMVIYHKLGGQRLCFSWALARKMLSKSKYYILSAMMVTIFAQTDKVMLKMLLGDAETGFYSAAVTCAGMNDFVFLAIIDSFRPVIFEHKKNQTEGYEINLIRLYSIVFYLGLLQSTIFTIASSVIVRIVYGQAYAAAVPILMIVTWYVSFSCMGTVRNIWILAEKRQKYLVLINILGAVINVIGNCILIPVWGGSGAAVASVLTQFFTNVVLNFIIKPIRPTSRLLIKSLHPKVLLNLIKDAKKGVINEN